MAAYSLEVTTGSMLNIGTFDNLYVTLIGTKRQSEAIHLNGFGQEDATTTVRTFSVTTLFSLGWLLFLKLEKDPYYESAEKEWYYSKIVVTMPDETKMLFPCQKWLSRGETVLLRGGRATKAFEDYHPRQRDQRKKELVLQKLLYKYEEYDEGSPYIISIKDLKALPAEVKYSFSKFFQLVKLEEALVKELKLRGLDSSEHWESFEAMKGVSWFNKSLILEYVSEHWKDDDFFGSQFLNGGNPHMIRRCNNLPSNFAVTEEMVNGFFANGSTLTAEMQKGNIFIADYKIMDGLPTRVIDGKPTPLAAPLCLLYLNPEKKLLPIAIQLNQQPLKENLIFLPSDLESDWLLAKIFVRNADVTFENTISHWMKTHELSEVFTLATLRNLPTIHPLYKLLVPHHLHTLAINVFARSPGSLLGPGGFLDDTTLQRVGRAKLMKRALSQTTYSSLCVPESIASRGLESIPNFYYRDDALMLWNIINRFVEAMVAYFYPSDSEVSADYELQEWINEIFYHGFLGNRDSGIPSSFETVEELIKFVTMVIFMSSVGHEVANGGTFAFQGWIPNAPLLLHQPPPTTKGQSSMETILLTLPTKEVGGGTMQLMWLLSFNYTDTVPLGIYPEQRFDEPAALSMIEDFQAELSSLSAAITQRNKELELPYIHLDPESIENSITI